MTKKRKPSVAAWSVQAERPSNHKAHLATRMCSSGLFDGAWGANGLIGPGGYDEWIAWLRAIPAKMPAPVVASVQPAAE